MEKKIQEDKESLLKDWVKFKKAEKKAKSNRVAVEEKLEGLYGTSFEGKSKTFKEDDLGFSVNIKKNIKHKLYQELWKSARIEIQDEMRPEKILFDLDVKGFEYLEEKEPEIYKQVSDCVEIKENKPTITVEKN